MRVRCLTVILALCTPALVHAQGPQRGGGAAPPPATIAQPALPAREPNTNLDELLSSVSDRTDTEFLVGANTPDQIFVSQIAARDIDVPVLLSILRNNGLAAVEIEGRVNIVPERSVRQLASQIVQDDDADIPDDLWVTRIIAVRDGAPTEGGPGRAAMLIPVLRPLLPPMAHFAALPDSSSIIIVDRYANVKRMSELIDQLTR